MKLKFFYRRLPLCFLLAASVSMSLFAAEPPKRKSGLWETTMQMQGMPNMGPMQQCVDQASDDIMRQPESRHKTDCSVMDIKPQGNKLTIHSVCKADGSTVTTDAVFTGAFDSSYKGEITTRFNPPMRGMSESKMSIKASMSIFGMLISPGFCPGLQAPFHDASILLCDSIRRCAG